jgi:hypothetical protein
VLVVPGIGADAENPRFARFAACGKGSGVERLSHDATGRCFPPPDSRAPQQPYFLGSSRCLSPLGGLQQISFIGLSFNLSDIAAEKIGDVVNVAPTGKKRYPGP